MGTFRCRRCQHMIDYDNTHVVSQKWLADHNADPLGGTAAVTLCPDCVKFIEEHNDTV